MTKKVTTPNKSKVYLLPLIADSIKFNSALHKHVTDTFCNFVEDEYENCIAIEIKYPMDHPEFTKYEKYMMDTDLFVKSFDKNDKTLYIFKIAEEYLHEYNKFKQSKFSEFKSDAKSRIYNYYESVYGKNNPNPIAIEFFESLLGVLYLTDDYRKALENKIGQRLPLNQELGNRINLIKETFVKDEYI
jgi:hypothetical protein